MNNPELAAVIAKANRREVLGDGELLQAQAYFFEVFIGCVIGQLTQHGKGAPRTDIEYLMDFFERNPSGIDEWKRTRQMIEPIVPVYCAEINRLLATRDEPSGADSPKTSNEDQ